MFVEEAESFFEVSLEGFAFGKVSVPVKVSSYDCVIVYPVAIFFYGVVDLCYVTLFGVLSVVFCPDT